MERKLTAILCADVYGYSRLMGEDEEATLRTLSAYRKIIDSLIENHRGRFVNSAGDSVLAEFTSVVEAVNCAVEIQNTLAAENAVLPLERRMEFRMGVNLGDVMVEGEQIYGDGVNVAARLESLAEPSGICISSAVHDHVRYKLPLAYEDIGEQTVKNIPHPVRVWRVKLDGAAAPPPVPGTRKALKRGGLSLAAIAIAIATLVIVQHVSLKPPHSSASIPPQEKPALRLPANPSVAVLPFTNLSGDPSQEYFSDGLTDLLITRLSRVPGVFVIAHASSFFYKGKAVTIQQVGRELGVRTILEGSVLKAGGRLRVNAQLADATNGAILWTQTFDQPLNDIFTMQDDIVRGIVTTLGLLFKLDRLQLRNVVREDRPTDNLEASDTMLRSAQSFWKFSKEGDAEARRLDQKAIALDPNYAEAYAALGWSYEQDVQFQWSQDPVGDNKRAAALAEKALALDESNTLALALASDNDRLNGRLDEAVLDAQRCVTTDPNYSWGYFWLGSALNANGKPSDAVSNIQKAIRIDPVLEDIFAGELGFAYLNMGRFPEAIGAYTRHAARHPNDFYSHVGLAIAYVELGRDQDARAEGAEVMRLDPQFTLATLEKAPQNKKRRNPAFDDDLRKAGLK
jgi:adenylate cyclase